jgi:hypothetical protein
MSDVKVTVGADASELDREMKRAASSVQRFDSEASRIAPRLREARVGMQGAGASMLALSNAVQDMTYGFRGAINNIPQLVEGLGGTMGMAGAAMGAAVAIDFLMRKLEESSKAMDAQLAEFAKPSEAMAERAKAAEAAAKAAAYNAAVHQEWLLYEEQGKRLAKETAEARAAAEAKVNDALREQIGLARQAIDDSGMDPEALRKKKIGALLEDARTSSMETARRSSPGSLKTSDDLKRLLNQVMASGEKIGLTGQLNILKALQEAVKLENEGKAIEKEKADQAAQDAASKKNALDHLKEQLEISRLLASGETDKAEALRKEIALRKEAADTAKATGMDEKKVLEQLRERERNIAQGEARKNQKPKRHFNAAESAQRRAARMSKSDKARGRTSNTDKLAEENMARRDQQRADRAARENKEAPGDKILQQILDAEKRQIDVWNRLTTSPV